VPASRLGRHGELDPMDQTALVGPGQHLACCYRESGRVSIGTYEALIVLTIAFP
jgi:hypothetical protein